MRALTALIVLLLLAGRGYGAEDSLAMVQRFAIAGAPQLALTRVEQLQPTASSAPRWDEWEQLRCSLMARLNQHQALAQRALALPANAPDTVARYCLLQGARSAIATSSGVAARVLLARLLWRSALPADDVRQARRLVIDSYLADGRSQDAYLLMLRYQQDFSPVDRDTAVHFVDSLLAAGMEKDAANWFAQLDDSGPLKLKMRLAAGLVTSDAAIQQARGMLANADDKSSWWQVVYRAAVLQNNRLLQIEALEHLLQPDPDERSGRGAALTLDLWRLYVAVAQDIANSNQLLIGDDASWLDFAARRAASDMLEGRALYAFIVQQAGTPEARRSAQLQLIGALRNARHDLVAVRLFSNPERFPTAQLDPQVRQLLGSMAFDNQRWNAAADWWLGLDAPAAVNADEWRLRLAQALQRVGKMPEAANVLSSVVANRTSLPGEVMRELIACAQDLIDAGEKKSAQALYSMLLPIADSRERRDILSALGNIAEANGEFRAAAGFYLESALLAEGRAPDAAAISARLAAVGNMFRAGLKDDARAQLDWLQKNVKDTNALEAIRRQAQRL